MFGKMGCVFKLIVLVIVVAVIAYIFKESWI